jgi:hypothetical protein
MNSSIVITGTVHTLSQVDSAVYESSSPNGCEYRRELATALEAASVAAGYRTVELYSWDGITLDAVRAERG